MIKHYHHAIGKVIKAARLTDEDALVLTFEDESTLTALDEAQCCCEARYMRTDDNLDDLVGCKLLDFEIKDAPSVEEDDDIHEVQFLEVKTDKGCVTMASHNEHNGYYGGFAISFMYKETA
jgi:hypothetical protein